MVYSRDEDDPECVSNFNYILKGNWKISTQETSESFIYKRIGFNKEHDELLTQIYT
jgi:hypothetical protein